MNPSLQLFTDLLVPSPSGREWDLAGIVRAKLDGIGYAHETDGAGNVIVRIPSDASAPLVCFAAHMDEIGMVVTRIEPDGTLRVARSGGLLPWKLGEGPVDILGDQATITGVLSMGSAHTAENGNKAIEWENCRVMTGLSPAQLKQAGVRPGTFALPERNRRGPVIFGDEADPLVGAWTFDDRGGVVTLIRLLDRMKQDGMVPHFQMMAVFTVSEEVGGLGAKVVAQRERPEVFISVDGSGRALGTNPIAAAVPIAGTELQPVVFESAASDASLVAYNMGVPHMACVGHVRENSHGFEVIRLSVLENVLGTLVEFVREWRG